MSRRLIKPKSITVDLVRCARCNKNHTTKFKRFKRPIEEYEYWSLCENTKEPIFLKFERE